MTRRHLFISLIAAALCGALIPALAKQGSAPQTHGSYDVVFAGSYSGDGKATVSAKFVNHIKGTVVDLATGETGSFNAGKMDLVDGRFEGDAVVLGATVKVVGRLEPPDGVVIKKARMTCTFCQMVNGQPVANKAGRILGSR